MLGRPDTIRFIDLCAGLGGFHRGLSLANDVLQRRCGSSYQLRCVLASELDPELRELYVRNFPDIQDTYHQQFPPRCMDEAKNKLAELHPELAPALDLYDSSGGLIRVHGDLNALVDSERGELRRGPSGDPLIPEHDLLCAGFPCQPFSKSGGQLGFEDTRGTLFHLIALIIEHKQPDLVLLENVGNFERHDSGNTWRRVRSILDDLGYDIAATEHKASGGSGVGLLSPHHIGLPHHRERFFVVAQRRGSTRFPPLGARYPFPQIYRHHRDARELRAELESKAASHLSKILANDPVDPPRDLRLAQVSTDRMGAIEHWGELLDCMRAMDERGHDGLRSSWRDSMPSFPIWAYELDPWQWYPIDSNPGFFQDAPEKLPALRAPLLEGAARDLSRSTQGKVDLLSHPPGSGRAFLGQRLLSEEAANRWVATWPGYAGKRNTWPRWKTRFIAQNREFALQLWAAFDPAWLRSWLDTLFESFPSTSHQKLEWNCKRTELDIKTHLVQFRPSGIRVQRLRHIPALVAMTTTQIPIVQAHGGGGPTAKPNSMRHLLPSEGLQLQGFPPDWKRPSSRERTFRALGNAVNAELIAKIVETWLAPGEARQSDRPGAGGGATSASDTALEGFPHRCADRVAVVPFGSSVSSVTRERHSR
jgi:DNA (cytosine-5)-methyltransferase 1